MTDSTDPIISFQVVLHDDGTATFTAGDRSETVTPYEDEKFRVPDWIKRPDA